MGMYVFVTICSIGVHLSEAARHSLAPHGFFLAGYDRIELAGPLNLLHTEFFANP